MKKKKLSIVVYVLLMTIIAPMNIAADESVFGNTIYVDDDGGADYARIQDAVDAANDGDTVFVYSGTYYENLIVNKSIILRGEDRDATVIDGGGRGYVIYVLADSVNISTFSIRNAGSYKYEWAGIDIYSDRNNISDNNISNNDHYGIYLKNSCSNVISGNNISNNGLCGIYFSSASNNTIIGNAIGPNNTCGMRAWLHSNCNTFIGNNISNNDQGMVLSFVSNNTTIIDNYFLNDGLFVDDSYQNIVTNNTVNGKHLVYLENKSDRTINKEAGQIILIDCNNITIQNQEFLDTDVGIELYNTGNCIISYNNISCNLYNILLYNSHNNYLFRNSIDSGVSCDGIFLDDSPDNIIVENTILHNIHGINLDSSINNTIADNIISLNNQNGIWLHTSSNNNTITGNIISSNTLHGLFLKDSYNNLIDSNSLQNNGCFVDDSYQNIVTNNTVNGKHLVYLENKSDRTINKEAGQIILIDCNNIIIQNQEMSYLDSPIQLISTHRCLISENTIRSNTFYGISLRNSHDNNISNNNISLNNNSIYFYGKSNHNYVIDNNITYNSKGINMDWSHYNTISRNIISNNKQGLYRVVSDSNIISNNFIISNNCGIYTDSGGIYEISGCVNTTILGNSIDNNICGIYLNCGSRNRINYNNFLNNEQSLTFYSSDSDDWNYNGSSKVFPLIF